METATVLIIFIASLLLGVTGYSMYTAFGPGSKDLRDPFEDHGAIRSQPRCNFHINWGRNLIFYNYGWI